MICAGIDTHKDSHVLVIADELGREMRHGGYPADEAGMAALAGELGDPEECIVVGIEGTGSYGAAIAALLAHAGFAVVEVSRPKRRERKRDKNDRTDALAAARRALAGEGVPLKPRGGDAEAIGHALAAYEQLKCTCTRLANAAQGIIVAAPDRVRSAFFGMSGKQIMEKCVRKRSSDDACEQAALSSLRALARAWREATSERDRLLDEIGVLLARHAPSLLEVRGCARVCSAHLVALAGEEPSRIRSEAALARMCGAAPVEASSGRVVRHRLDRGGSRRANSALHMIVVCRMAHDERTRAYVERRTQEGLSKREIMRCLKRYVAREIYRVLCAEERRRKAEMCGS